MKFTILLNQSKSLEWELNHAQAILFAYIFELPSWAEQATISNQTYYWCSKTKIINDLPFLTDKTNTVHKLIKQLEEKGLLILKKQGTKDLIMLTRKVKEWSFDNLEKNPSLENYPNGQGFLSKNNLEKNPTDYIISKTNSLDKEEKIKNSKIKFCKQVIDWATKNPDKYPKLMYFEFTKHWLELAQSGNSVRYEDEKFFEIGKRLATWFTFSDDKKLSDQWQAETKTETINALLRKLL